MRIENVVREADRLSDEGLESLYGGTEMMDNNNNATECRCSGSGSNNNNKKRCTCSDNAQETTNQGSCLS